MSWNIECLKNDLPLSEACVADLTKVAKKCWEGYEGSGEPNICQKGKFYFNPDHFEHQDYLPSAWLLKILKKHKVNGAICFGSLEGDNAGEFWGYQFDDGFMSKLEGTMLWSVVA